ncbi:condensation domain-containing protein, partial [Paenibacillus larvae]
VGFIKQSSKNHILMIDMHHIISDGMSVDLIAADFFDLYAGVELPKLPIQYKDYVVWQNEKEYKEEVQKQEDYWMEVFEKDVSPLELPNDFKRNMGVLESEASIASFVIDKDLTGKVRDFAVCKNSSLFVLLLAVYNVILSKCCAQEDIVVGTATSGRNHDDLTRVVGMFVKTVPLRNFPAEDKIFSRFLEEVHQNSLLSFQNQDYPFDMLVSKLNLGRDLNRNPLFDTFFQIQYFEERKKEVGDLVFHPYTYKKNNTSQFELELSVEEEQEQIEFHFYYSTHLYKNKTIHKLWNDYLQVLRTVLQDDQVKLGDIRLGMENKKKKEIRKLHDSIQFNF